MSVRLDNRGTLVNIRAGGEYVIVAKQYWGTRIVSGSSNPGTFGINGIGKNSNYWTRYCCRDNGNTSSLWQEVNHTASQDADGSAFGELCPSGGWFNGAQVHFTCIRSVAPNDTSTSSVQYWAIHGTGSKDGCLTIADFDVQCNTGANRGAVPTIYQRGAVVPGSWWNVLEVLEIIPN